MADENQQVTGSGAYVGEDGEEIKKNQSAGGDDSSSSVMGIATGINTIVDTIYDNIYQGWEAKEKKLRNRDAVRKEEERYQNELKKGERGGNPDYRAKASDLINGLINRMQAFKAIDAQTKQIALSDQASKAMMQGIAMGLGNNSTNKRMAPTGVLPSQQPSTPTWQGVATARAQ
jgi:hypothetical protein